MRVPRHVFFAVFVLAAFCQLSAPALGESDQAAAERALGPQWKQVSRRAGMVFAGTVLSGPAQATPLQIARTDRAVPSVALRFRVDRAIAGVEFGQILTVREWTGAQSLHPPMRPGERFLLFLYPPSRLGLTSPVGGTQGQVRLDGAGRDVTKQQLNASVPVPHTVPASLLPRTSPPSTRAPASATTPVSIDQLERAIRTARGE